jgi:hypothetical protein
MLMLLPPRGRLCSGVFLPHGGESETFIFRPCTSENPATAKGTTCFRNFSVGNDLFTTFLTAQMGRGKIQAAFTSRRWTHENSEAVKIWYQFKLCQSMRFFSRTI